MSKGKLNNVLYYHESEGSYDGIFSEFIEDETAIAYIVKSEYDQLKTENERLREALKWIDDKCKKWEQTNDIGNPDKIVFPWWNLGDKARYTLKALNEVTK